MYSTNTGNFILFSHRHVVSHVFTVLSGSGGAFCWDTVDTEGDDGRADRPAEEEGVKVKVVSLSAASS